MADGKVQVELELLLKKAREQLKSIKKEMGDAFEGKSGAAAGKSSGLEKETGKVVAHTKAVKEMGKAIQDTKFKTAEYYKSLDAFGKPYKGVISINAAVNKKATLPPKTVAELRAEQEARDRAEYGPLSYRSAGTISGMAFPKLAPLTLSPSGKGVGQPLAASVAAAGPQPKTIASIVNNVVTMPLTKLGAMAVQAVGALAALRVAVGLVGYGLRLITAPFRAFANTLQRAADAARANYARGLQSGGLPMGFVIQRAQLASIIGVSESEVLKYGGAISFLNSKLQWSTKIMTETNPALTAMGWNFRVLGQDFTALMAKMADSFAVLTKEVTEWLDRGVREGGNILDESSRRISEGAYRDQMRRKGIKTLPEFEGGGRMQGFPRRIAGDTTGEQWKEFMKFHAERMGWGKDAAPPLDVGSRRMKGSAWERMGLVVGAGTAVNYQAATARNTDATAKLLAKLVGLFPAHITNSARRSIPNRS